jgi:TRAP-type C4-dicarboxylate transport system permease small subunit
MLGIIFIILVIYGGFTYMNARGEKDKVTKGIAIIRMAIIGLVIILGAYAIWHYIYLNLIM